MYLKRFSHDVKVWGSNLNLKNWHVGLSGRSHLSTARHQFQKSLKYSPCLVLYSQHEASRSKKSFCWSLFTWHLVSPHGSSSSRHRCHMNWLLSPQHTVEIPQHSSHSLKWWRCTLRGCTSKLPGEMFAHSRPKISKCQQWAFHNCRFTGVFGASASRYNSPSLPLPQAEWTSAGQATCQSCDQLTNHPGGKQKSQEPLSGIFS